MSEQVLTDNEALFKQLRKRPVVAWPTVFMMLVCHTVIGFVWYFGIKGDLPLWAGCIINGIAMYYLFSPVHDSMHQAVFTNSRLNNIFLFVTVFPIIPLSTGQFLRMMHMQHHRFANDDLDPDHEVSRNTRNVLFGWWTWEFAYTAFFQSHKKDYPNFKKSLFIWDHWSIYIVLVPLFIMFPLETVFFWLIPTRIMSWLICAVFMHLPHRPHDVKHSKDPYKATLIRQGHEWLLSPLMANQNYHLVHHLYPTVPFYRYKKVWDSKLKFHMSHNPAIVGAFQLNPTIKADQDSSMSGQQEGATS